MKCFSTSRTILCWNHYWSMIFALKWACRWRILRCAQLMIVQLHGKEKDEIQSKQQSWETYLHELIRIPSCSFVYSVLINTSCMICLLVHSPISMGCVRQRDALLMISNISINTHMFTVYIPSLKKTHSQWNLLNSQMLLLDLFAKLRREGDSNRPKQALLLAILPVHRFVSYFSRDNDSHRFSGFSIL